MSNGLMRDETLSIGAAARLFGLAPSTLRWWEAAGLLAPPHREAGRRCYGPAEINRIALIHLCRNTGLMSIEDVGEVVSGRAGGPHWHQTVRARMAALDQQIRRLSRAREYLQHTLTCSHDDPSRCPHFEREVRQHIPGLRAMTTAPNGRATRVARPAQRDETADTPPTPSHPSGCPVCGRRLAQPRTGRRRRYCSRACQQHAYRARARRAWR
jgi:MerR family copper efflux transcriptional regulator